jgi:hypothetical protein
MDEHDIETRKRFSVNQLERMMRTKFEAVFGSHHAQNWDA